MIHQQKGYILFITFSILALCTALISVTMIKGITHKKLTSALLDQEKLQEFAISIPALAQSFLAVIVDPQAKEQSAQKTSGTQKTQSQEESDPDKKLLEKILPVVNKTEKFMMKSLVKDFPVVINLTFFCESGKININGLYDLVNQSFYDEGVAGKDQKVFATWLFDRIAVLTEKPSLLQPFVEHVKQRKIPFNDVTQLLSIKEFAACFQDAVFYEQNQSQDSTHKKNKKLFLTDLFTVASESDTIQPWLLSESVCALLDIQPRNNKDKESDKKEDNTIDLSTFKSVADWKKDWDISLKPLYGISYDKIPEQCAGMLAPQFSGNVFSILATVKQELVDDENNKAIRIFAMLKQKQLPDNSIIYDVIKTYQV